MADKAKRRIRTIQDLTGWPYQFCLFLCRGLGADAVLAALAAERPGGDAPLSEISRQLNERAKAAGRVASNQGVSIMPTEPTKPTQEQKLQIERSIQTAIIYGANDLATKAATLGEKVFWRLLREDAVRKFVELGGRADLTHDPVVLSLPGNPPHVTFTTRDIELMRATVAAHDAAPAAAAIL